MPTRAPTDLSLLVLRMLVLVAVVLAVVVLLARTGAAGGPPPPTQTHVVAAGDTLWGIARSVVGPGGDVRPVIAVIEQLNGLDSDDIVPGQQLVVPVR